MCSLDILPQVTFMVDSFPIVVQEPNDAETGRALYSGKYKSCVFKFNLYIDMSGCPIALSPPCIGTMADINMHRRYSPFTGRYSLRPGEQGLADLAYKSADLRETFITQFKRRAGQLALPVRGGERHGARAFLQCQTCVN